MKRSKIQLFVAATLFTGWIIYLASLSARPKQTVVLSRAALAETDFVVKIALPAEPVGDDTEFVCDAVFGIGPNAPKPGDKLKIRGIAGVKQSDGKPLTVGDWLVPVQSNGGNVAEAVATGTFPSYKSSFGPMAWPAEPVREAELTELMGNRSARTR